jgi:hypothetical protein
MSDATTSATPIASFREKSPGLRRTHTLFADKVVIDAFQFGGTEFVVNIPLSNLTPDINPVRYRSRRWRAGAMLCAGLAFFLWLFIAIFKLPWDSPRVLVTISLCVACFAWAAVYYPKYTAYRFINSMGVVVLDVIESGPEKANARGFAEQISSAIRRCQEKHAMPSPPAE